MRRNGEVTIIKKGHTFLGFIVGIIVGFLIFGGALQAGFVDYLGFDQTKSIDVKALRERLRDMDFLVSKDYVYTSSGSYHDQWMFKNFKIPFTEKGFVVTYSGEIKAGVDMSRADVNVSGNTVNIKLPKAEVASNTIDQNSIKVLDEDKNIFNRLEVSDFKEFESKQKKVMLQEAEDKGLLESAGENAEKNVRELISAAVPKGTKVNVTPE
ncbi:MAG: DUF4230 domain-containing protein [Eubacteriales bacterium]|nr:DUF4230 domain-containing protein [Eubacteriales bacterium]